MIVLDTNVISALIQATPDPSVVAWVNAQQTNIVWTTAITIFEIQFGLAAMPAGQRRQTLQQSFEKAVAQLGQRGARTRRRRVNKQVREILTSRRWIKPATRPMGGS